MRHRLPNRRHAQAIDFDNYLVTIGHYPNGAIGEVFIDAKKHSTDVANLGHDAATIISIAIQHGIPIAEMAAACGRTVEGAPHTVIGAVLDLLIQESSANIL